MGSSQPESQIDSSNLDGVSNPQIGLEYPPVDEEKAIAALRQLHLKVHQVSPGPGLRGEHPKAIAGVWATFRIADDIPAQYRIGLFSEPRTFRALIRFSNGRSFDDRVANVRGMAIKVFTAHDENAPALNQDFLLIDHPIFFARNVQHTLEFLIASSSGTPSAQLAETTHPKLKGFNSIATQSPLKMSYWSTTPYQLGTGAVKYFAYPSAKQDQPQPDLVLSNSENSLREAMTEQLTRQKIGVNFDFAINPQTDASSMPVEDPTIEWTSDPVRLATISIYPQRFDSEAQMQFVENTDWSPWNFLPEHRPLGGINRARRWIYSDSKELRHKTNGVTPTVPTGRESF